MLKRVELDHSAIEYLRAESESTLARKLAQLPLDKGEIETYVPAGTSIEKVKQYSYGGIGNVVAMGENTIALIVNFLSQMENHPCVIIEDIIDTPQSLQKYGQEYPILVYGEEAYYVIGQEEYDLHDKLLKILPLAAVMYPYIGIITHYAWSKESYSLLTDDDITQIAEQTEMIFASAYDNEGFVIWRRKKH